MAIHGWSMDKRGKTIGNIVSDTLTFMDDMGLSMAASDNPLVVGFCVCYIVSGSLLNDCFVSQVNSETHYN